MQNGEITQVQQRARHWLINVAAPFWGSIGRTDSGLFAERVTLDGVPDDSYFRTFVQARHIFSIVTAGQNGWTGPWRELVAETIGTIIARAKREDGLFVHRLDRDASILDRRADLYDQAFVLFALGTAGGVLDDESLFDEAEALLDRIESLWSHPDGGFREGEIVDLSIRRQNPHMHLLEAFSALHMASGRQRFGDAALSIARLCSEKFIDRDSGALLEYFGDDWTPAPGQQGRLAEPGHCFEWAWLFERLAAGGWSDAVALSDAMTGFGRRFGLDADRGVAINEISTDGVIVDGKARLWPQTERLKVALARYRRTGSPEESAEAVAAYRGLEQYYLPANPALWRDKLKEDGNFIEELAPGSSFYHISCAVGELLALRHPEVMI